MALGHVTGSKLKQVMLGIFELRLKALVGLTVVYGFTVYAGFASGLAWFFFISAGLAFDEFTG